MDMVSACGVVSQIWGMRMRADPRTLCWQQASPRHSHVAVAVWIRWSSLMYRCVCVISGVPLVIITIIVAYYTPLAFASSPRTEDTVNGGGGGITFDVSLSCAAAHQPPPADCQLWLIGRDHNGGGGSASSLKAHFRSPCWYYNNLFGMGCGDASGIPGTMRRQNSNNDRNRRQYKWSAQPCRWPQCCTL